MKPWKPKLVYYVSVLPPEILAIIRVSYYHNGKLCEVTELTLIENGQTGYDTFHAMVTEALSMGANVSIRSGYDPADLGIQT